MKDELKGFSVTKATIEIALSDAKATIEIALSISSSVCPFVTLYHQLTLIIDQF